MNPFQAACDYLARRRTAYVKTFMGPMGQEVLADLARFCRATESTFHPDARAHAVAEGRREVFLRISKHLQLTDDQLWSLYGTPTQPVRKNDE